MNSSTTRIRTPGQPPSKPTIRATQNVNKVAVDFYASEYVSGFGLSTMAAADNASPPKKLGIGEMGVTLTSIVPPQAQVMSYFSYVQSVMIGRIQAGKSNGEMAWA
jgi:hypothetical protein